MNIRTATTEKLLLLYIRIGASTSRGYIMYVLLSRYPRYPRYTRLRGRVDTDVLRVERESERECERESEREIPLRRST